MMFRSGSAGGPVTTGFETCEGALRMFSSLTSAPVSGLTIRTLF